MNIVTLFCLNIELVSIKQSTFRKQGYTHKSSNLNDQGQIENAVFAEMAENAVFAEMAENAEFFNYPNII